MNHHQLAVALASLAFSLGAEAATPDNADGATATPPAVAAPLSSQDHSFVSAFLLSGHAEVDLGELAAQRARDPRVRQLGKQLASERREADQRLADITADMQLPSLPTEPDAAHKGIAKQMRQVDAQDFDRLYLDSQSRDHDNTISLLQQEAGSGDNAELKRFAQDMLDQAQRHHQEISRISEALKGK